MKMINTEYLIKMLSSYFLCHKPVAVQATWLWGHILQRNIYINVFSIISIPDFSLHRLILTVWGVVTIVVGAFVFGQSTTIAVMELVHQFWMLTPACSSWITVTSDLWAVWDAQLFCTTESSIFLKVIFSCISIHALYTKHLWERQNLSLCGVDWM